MPAGQDPVAPHFDRIGVVTEVQCYHGCTADRRFSDDLQAIVRPGKMLVPAIGAWIEQGRVPVAGSMVALLASTAAGANTPN
jgi:hypothetical protein